MQKIEDNSEKEPQYWIEQLGLEPHPEGGYFNEVYRSHEGILQQSLPTRFTGDRSFCTSIYYLLEGNDFSAFHRIKSDETWHFYAGGPLDVVMLSQEGPRIERLGRNLHKGEVLQMTIPAEVWFAARPTEGSLFTLAGCTVSPGFDFEDFEIGDRQELCAQFPMSQGVIVQLTRG